MIHYIIKLSNLTEPLTSLCWVRSSTHKLSFTKTRSGGCELSILLFKIWLNSACEVFESGLTASGRESNSGGFIPHNNTGTESPENILHLAVNILQNTVIKNVNIKVRRGTVMMINSFQEKNKITIWLTPLNRMSETRRDTNYLWFLAEGYRAPDRNLESRSCDRSTWYVTHPFPDFKQNYSIVLS